MTLIYSGSLQSWLSAHPRIPRIVGKTVGKFFSHEDLDRMTGTVHVRHRPKYAASHRLGQAAPMPYLSRRRSFPEELEHR